jgi:hypothetical protein
MHPGRGNAVRGEVTPNLYRSIERPGHSTHPFEDARLFIFKQTRKLNQRVLDAGNDPPIGSVTVQNSTFILRNGADCGDVVMCFHGQGFCRVSIIDDHHDLISGVCDVREKNITTGATWIEDDDRRETVVESEITGENLVERLQLNAGTKDTVPDVSIVFVIN